MQLVSETFPHRIEFDLEVPYPDSPRSKCDIVIRSPEAWSIEVKMLRFMGDNGKPNDNILMHILSPYPAHRSALTDAGKLYESALPGRKGIVIYGYDYDQWPMDPAIEAFETLVSLHYDLSGAQRGRDRALDSSDPYQRPSFRLGDCGSRLNRPFCPEADPSAPV